jgi:hypothetical protein
LEIAAVQRFNRSKGSTPDKAENFHVREFPKRRNGNSNTDLEIGKLLVAS